MFRFGFNEGLTRTCTFNAPVDVAEFELLVLSPAGLGGARLKYKNHYDLFRNDPSSIQGLKVSMVGQIT